MFKKEGRKEKKDEQQQLQHLALSRGEVPGLEDAQMGREGEVSLSQTLRFGIAGFLLNCHQLPPTLKGD